MAGIIGALNSIILEIRLFASVLLVFALCWAGLTFQFADREGPEKGKRIIKYALFGYTLVMASTAIVEWLKPIVAF